MRLRKLLGACVLVAASLAVPRFAAAAGDSIFLTFTDVVTPISPAYIALFNGTEGTTVSFDAYATLAAIPAGDSTQSVVISPVGSSQTVPADLGGNTPTSYAIAGVYSNDPDGLSVVTNTTEAAAVEGQPFASVFPAELPENEVVSFLQAPNLSLLPTSLQSFVNGFQGEVSPAVVNLDGSTGDIVNFSNGTAGGTVTASIGPTAGTTSPVPLPPAATAGAVLLLALAAIQHVRRIARV